MILFLFLHALATTNVLFGPLSLVRPSGRCYFSVSALRVFHLHQAISVTGEQPFLHAAPRQTVHRRRPGRTFLRPPPQTEHRTATHENARGGASGGVVDEQGHTLP